MSLSKKFIVGGYDAHGSSTAVAVARSQNIPLQDVLIKFPDTSPENLPKLLYSLNLYNAEIFAVDIAINVKNPNDFINTVKVVADNNALTFIDHHESNLKYLSLLPRNVRFLQFPTASSMAKAIEEMFYVSRDLELLLVGVIGDRDDSIKELIDIGSPQFSRLYNLSNVYDVLIRQNLGDSIRGIYQDGISYIERSMGNIQYPPSQLANQLKDKITKHDNIVYVDATVIPQNMSMWIWKTFDEILRREHADYLVATARVLDRQLNTMVDVVFVVKFWLSDLQPPKQLLTNVIGNRRTIGHDSAFSISASSQQDAMVLAQQVINALESTFSVSASYIPAGDVAKALHHDFRSIMEQQTQILQKLTEILQLQQENYAKYNQLKEEQISMLRRVTNNTDVHRAD